MAYPVDVPEAVKQEHQEGRLVFFCGAGISGYTNLPDFKGLVKNAFEACSVPLAGRKLDASEPWDYAFRQGQYDKALYLLEKEVKPRVMRTKITAILTRDLPRKLKGRPKYHKAILDLSERPDGGYHLVTTNFDNRFELAGLQNKWMHDAPRLAPPRRGDWQHVTYLHGRIGEHDAAGRHMVLTSADFGRAYLHDAWAARFVVELFRNFTVLFVGYGVNDPVMSYLIDALASDMGPGGQFRRAYAFAGYNGTDEDRIRQSKEWEAKNIALIPVDTGRNGRNFGQLYETLSVWARAWRGGLESRVRDVLQATQSPYHSIPEHMLRDIAWSLSDPRVARQFAQKAAEAGNNGEDGKGGDESPHISWLEPLSQVDLYLDGPERPSVRLFDMPALLGKNTRGHAIPVLAPLAGHGAANLSGLPLAEVSRYLIGWLTANLETDELVHWIEARHGLVHPHLRDAVRIELPNVVEPYRTFWEVIVSGAMAPRAEGW